MPNGLGIAVVVILVQDKTFSQTPFSRLDCCARPPAAALPMSVMNSRRCGRFECIQALRLSNRT
jgi:hypothetical protein